MSRYDLTDFEWRVIEPLLPNKPRGAPRVDNRRVLNGIFWMLRSGAPSRELPQRYASRTTCYNRSLRWRKADGAVVSVVGIGGMAMAKHAGYLLEKIGSYSPIFTVAVSVYLLALLVAYLLSSRLATEVKAVRA